MQGAPIIEVRFVRLQAAMFALLEDADTLLSLRHLTDGSIDQRRLCVKWRQFRCSIRTYLAGNSSKD